MDGRIDGKVHILPIRIYYEDTDFSGMVYHANYARYCERGRSSFLADAGVPHRDLLKLDDPLAFTLQRIELDFFKPARIDDLLHVHTIYTEARGARLSARQRVYRESELLVEAVVRAACISLDGRPRRLPPLVMNALGDYVTDGFPD
jgi:acyl-CoA thioester hydrolase